jgi:Protein of unknown function (DUF2752)
MTQASKMTFAARPGVPAFIVGCITLADLAIGRALLRADEMRVYVAGRALDLQCAFRAATGLPCPTCGVTRSVAMSLHGEFARAWNMAPAGPVAVLGLLAFALAMLALALIQWAGAEDRTAWMRLWIRRGALAYGTAATVVWLGGWAVHFEAALRAR